MKESGEETERETGRGRRIVEGEGKETEGEMKQSRGSLSVDRSFRARSINTNLY